MADITSQFDFHETRRSGFGRALASIGRGFDAYMTARSRRDQLEALEAKSDADLREMGLRRDQIAAFVFRDRFFV